MKAIRFDVMSLNTSRTLGCFQITWGAELKGDIPTFGRIFVGVFVSNPPDQTKNYRHLKFGAHTPLDHLR